MEAYVYDGQDMVLKFARGDENSLVASDLQTRYLHGPAVDQILAEEALSTLTSGGYDLTTAGNVYWMLGDHEGTIRDVADYNSGTKTTSVVNHLQYASFGEIRGQDDTYTPTFTYTGRQYDADSELYYYRARWYDAKVGRFISKDPISIFGGDNNLYRYCGNSPNNFIDPTGLDDRIILGYKVLNIPGHHPIPVETWEDSQLHPNAFSIWDNYKARIVQPEGTGHNYLAHGSKTGYSAEVARLMDEELTIFRKQIKNSELFTEEQSKVFAKRLLLKIKNMPSDSFIGGYNNALKNGGTQGVRLWYNTEGKELLRKPSSGLLGGGGVGAAGGVIFNPVSGILEIHDTYIQSLDSGRTFWEQLKWNARHTIYWDPMLDDALHPTSY